jgi:CHAD domain-containing protein
LARLGLVQTDTLAAEQGAREFSDRVLARRHRKLTAWQDPVGLDRERLHRLRIATKKLRYVAEFFAPLYAHKAVKRFTENLEGLQDLLGTINDAQVSAEMIELSARGGRRALDREAVGLARGWIAARDALAREHLSKAWRSFLALESYWQ